MLGADEVVERSAAPTEVRTALARLTALHPDLPDRMAADPDGTFTRALVAVAGASRSLTRLLTADAAALDVIADLAHRPPCTPANPDELVRWKRLELLRLAARDLVGLDGFEVTGSALARMATDVLQASIDLARPPSGLAIVAMGKTGGDELNYASDVDIMVVGERSDDETERAARNVLAIARRCFRVDPALRPEGRDGPLVRTIDGYATHWAERAEAWEFQALLKARAVAGDAELRRAFDRTAAEHLWSRPFSADDLRAVRAMKARTEAVATRARTGHRELKRTPGGIRDVEFAVQLLQLVHGRHDPALRSRATLDALGALAAAGYIDADDGDLLADSFELLRRVENALQLVEEQPVHALPDDPAARRRLARVLRYRATPERSADQQLDDDLAECRSTVRSIHERLWFRPLLEAFAGADAPLRPEAAADRLAAFGFTDAERTRQAVRELTRGLTRSSRLMQQLLPVLLGWLSDAPDPDLGLLGLRTLASGPARSNALAGVFRDSPEVARRLCLVLGTSRHLGRLLEHNPDLIADLGAADAFRLRRRDELVQAARGALDWRDDVADRRTTLHRLTDREGLRIGAHDVLGLASTPEVGHALTHLAEAAVVAALDGLRPGVPFAVIALGRLAGGELSYASDLDLVFVHEASGPDEAAEADRVASGFNRLLNGDTPAGMIYDVDLDLRPEGRNGPLSRTLPAWEVYLGRWAQTWERQALARCRAVAGDPDLSARFLTLVDGFVWHGLTAEDRRSIRRMKARIERARLPARDDPEFHLKLGRGALADVEWTVQMLQLAHDVRQPSTVRAIAELHDRRFLAADDAEVLLDAYRFCEEARNRWFLVRGQRSDSLPGGRSLEVLARSLGTTGPALRDHYRRVTRRSRRVVERLFYDRPHDR
jgi:glutamate-ammonia-ligase adenylyltransferase